MLITEHSLKGLHILWSNNTSPVISILHHGELRQQKESGYTTSYIVWSQWSDISCVIVMFFVVLQVALTCENFPMSRFSSSTFTWTFHAIITSSIQLFQITSSSYLPRQPLRLRVTYYVLASYLPDKLPSRVLTSTILMSSGFEYVISWVQSSVGLLKHPIVILLWLLPVGAVWFTALNEKSASFCRQTVDLPSTLWTSLLPQSNFLYYPCCCHGNSDLSICPHLRHTWTHYHDSPLLRL